MKLLCIQEVPHVSWLWINSTHFNLLIIAPLGAMTLITEI